jgi:hypothetical protein
MPGARLPVRKIREVLLLRAAGMSKRKIAASLSIGMTAAGDCVRRARRAGLSWPLPDHLSDEALERVLYPLQLCGGTLGHSDDPISTHLSHRHGGTPRNGFEQNTQRFQM